MPAKSAKQLKPDKLTPARMLELYRALIKPRLIEEKMLLLLRQGRITKWFSGIGQEAIAVGVSSALKDDEFILPMMRNLGVFTTRKIPLRRLFSQFKGKAAGFTNGRDRSFHFGSKEHHIVGMISHLGPQLCVADGVALAEKLQSSNKVTAVFCGDGGTSQGDFHEALNVAAVWKLPVIFIIENNCYALSTPTSEQYVCAKLSDRAAGYGMPGVTIDGNDLLEVYSCVSGWAQKIRADKEAGPVLIECETFRMRGHEEASGTKYVPKGLAEKWAKKDPIKRFQSKLEEAGILTKQIEAKYREEIMAEIEAALDQAFHEPDIEPDTAKELGDLFAPCANPAQLPRAPRQGSERRLIDAVSEGLREGLARHQNLLFMGQDVAEYGGVFKVSEGFVEEFGRERVRNTPLCESAILGAALGLSVKGMKSVVEMQFADFVSCGFNQIANNLAKAHYRWGQNADVVIRMPTGGGSAAGPFHSQSDEAWFTHIPGLKVVFPSTAYDAKGLLLAAIEDPNPVLFFEHKALYRSIKDFVPDEYYTLPLGKARVVQEGRDITVITYGSGVYWALEEQAQNPEISMLILDLRSLVPLDVEAIESAVSSTGRVIILHEATLTSGFGGEVAAFIAERCFEKLDAPVIRCASLDTPVPFNARLEQNFFPRGRFNQALMKLAVF